MLAEADDVLNSGFQPFRDEVGIAGVLHRFLEIVVPRRGRVLNGSYPDARLIEPRIIDHFIRIESALQACQTDDGLENRTGRVAVLCCPVSLRTQNTILSARPFTRRESLD